MSNRFTTPGDFSWTELMTTDVEAAKAFYVNVLGWETEEMPMEAGTYHVLKAGGKTVGGIMKMPPNVPAGTPPAWSTYVTVADVDETARKVVEHGGRLLVSPKDIPNVGRFCTLQDPQGAIINAMTYAPMEDE